MKTLIQDIVALLRRQQELGLVGLDGDFSRLDAPWFFEKSGEVGADKIPEHLPAPKTLYEAPNSVAELKAALDARVAPAGSRARRSPAGAGGLPSANTNRERTPLQVLRDEVAQCTQCSLSRSRSQVVFGEGRIDSELVFVGDAPGRDEDRQAEPFLGDVGELLDKMLSAMGLLRHQVYLTTLAKCRPPRGKMAEAAEMQTCLTHLEGQLDLIRPKVVVTMGQTVSQVFLNRQEPITELRGQFHQRGSLKVMPTYHPAYLLKVPKAKKVVWEDLQQVMGELGLKGR